MSAKSQLSRLASIMACGLILCAASSVTAAPMPFSETGPGLNDVDGNVPVSVTQIVGTNGTITDLNIMITTSTEFPEEVTWTLSKDGGPSVVFWNVNAICDVVICNQPVQFSITFDDEAAMQVMASDSLSDLNGGTFQPSGGGLLSSFDGVLLAGTWRLTMVNNNDFGNGTDLISWRIFGTVETDAVTVPEPGTLALFGLGLAGAGFIRRRIAA